MSELNNDRKVIDEGRRKPLKGAAAPLRDQVVRKLLDRLIEMKVGQKVVETWQAGSSNRTTWLERQKTYLATWDEHLVPSNDGPFSGSSNLHIPLPLTVVKTMHARFYQAMLGIDPPFHVKARNEASMERVSVVSDTLAYTINKWSNRYKGVDEVVDKYIWKWVSEGSAVAKARWDVKWERFVDVAPVREPAAPRFEIVNGKEVAIPQTRIVEREVTVEKKVFEGPAYENINLEDLLIVGGDGDPDRADVVQHRTWLTASELWHAVDRKVFLKDVVEEIIEGGPDSQEGSEGSDIKIQRTQSSGRAQLDTAYDLDRYEIIEDYRALDVDGSGINTEVIVWVHKRSMKELGATYLRRVSKAGERPFFKADFHLRPGQEYGTGIVELIYPLSKEMDAIHNMRIDFGLISVMPFGFYRSTSGIEPENLKLEPGVLIPVDNPATDVFFPNLGNRTVFGFQEEGALQNMIERLTSIGDMQLGMLSGQGAARTATGARALVGEASANLDVYLRRLNRAWRRWLEYTMHMLQQRIPAGLSFRVTGDTGADYWRQIKSSSDIAGDFDIEVSPNTASSNQGIQQQNAQEILGLVSNPLAIQLGIVTPAQFYEAYKNRLQSLGIKDYGRFIQKPQGPTRLFTPEEEANRLLRGIDVPVTPEMDHEGFINYFKMIEGDDELLGQFNEEQTIALAKQAMKHAQMMKALQEMAAQQANASQMQRNAAMSQQQAPVGMNPMEGANSGAAGA
jgi:hypothetical protein